MGSLNSCPGTRAAATYADMVVDQTGKVTLRVGRREFSRLGLALAVSLAAHLLFWGGYATVKHFNLTAKLKFPQWVQRLLTPPPRQQAKVEPQNREPYIFIDVREAQSVAEPPKNAIRYSDRNAIAANPDDNKNLNEPKVEGEKNELQKLDDAGRRNKFDQLMPDPPKPESEAQSQPKRAPGTMTVAKADLRPPQERQRPRTLRDVMLQNQAPGKRSQQDGGAKKPGDISYDVRTTEFGAYDRALIDAVRFHWYNLLDSLSAENYQQGRVVVQFDLDYQGKATNIRVLESTVSESLALWCVKAVNDPSPYGEWTREMRMRIGEDSRRITFTFHYF